MELKEEVTPLGFLQKRGRKKNSQKLFPGERILSSVQNKGLWEELCGGKIKKLFSRKRRNTRIPIKSKLEAVQFAKMFNNNSQAALKFGVDESTIRRWRLKEEQFKKQSHINTKITLHKGKESKFKNIEHYLINFIDSNRKMGNPISTLAIIAEIIKLCPEAKDASKGSLRVWVYRFMKRYTLSFRSSTHIGQKMPDNVVKEVKKFFKKVIKERVSYPYGLKLICNMDETPIFLNMPPSKTIAKKGAKTVFIRTHNQEKVRISVLLTIAADGTKLPPFVIFKDKKHGKNEENLKKLPMVQNGEVFVACNENAWSTTHIMKKWLNKVWIPYVNKINPEDGQGLMIIDSAPSHIKPSLLEYINKKKQKYVLIPPGMTRVLQPLDVSINGPFKRYMKNLYIDECIRNKDINMKISREQILKWILEIWHDESKIKKINVENSFKYCGISNSLNGEEDGMIQVLKKINDEDGITTPEDESTQNITLSGIDLTNSKNTESDIISNTQTSMMSNLNTNNDEEIVDKAQSISVMEEGDENIMEKNSENFDDKNINEENMMFDIDYVDEDMDNNAESQTMQEIQNILIQNDCFNTNIVNKGNKKRKNNEIKNCLNDNEINDIIQPSGTTIYEYGKDDLDSLSLNEEEEKYEEINNDNFDNKIWFEQGENKHEDNENKIMDLSPKNEDGEEKGIVMPINVENENIKEKEKEKDISINMENEDKKNESLTMTDNKIMSSLSTQDNKNSTFTFSLEESNEANLLENILFGDEEKDKKLQNLLFGDNDEDKKLKNLLKEKILKIKNMI